MHNTDSTHCDLSIVIPFFNEELSARGVVEHILSTFRQAGFSFEIVCVQNGSRDRTPEILAALEKENPEVVLVTIPKNEGFGAGVLKGLRACRGNILGYMPGDGRIDPSVV